MNVCTKVYFTPLFHLVTTPGIASPLAVARPAHRARAFSFLARVAMFSSISGTASERIGLIDPASRPAVADRDDRAHSRSRILSLVLAGSLAALAAVALVGGSRGSFGTALRPFALGQADASGASIDPSDPGAVNIVVRGTDQTPENVESYSVSVPGEFDSGGSSQVEIPAGHGIDETSGMTSTTACGMKETFCELEFFNDYMHLCCEFSDDPATQQDCLCNPLNYGLEAEMTDNVGVDEVPTLGARRAGNFAKPPKLGTFSSPGCGVAGYCQSPEEHGDDALFVTCCDGVEGETTQNDCLCNPITYMV